MPAEPQAPQAPEQLQLQPGHLIVWGETGLGKTALVRSLVLMMGSRPASATSWTWDRVLILDNDEEYGQVAVGAQTYDEVVNTIEQAGAHWVVAYQGDSEVEVAWLVEAAIELKEKPPGRNLVFIAEEVDLYAQPGKVEIPTLLWIAKRGRKHQVYLCSVARRPSEVHRLLSSQARHVFCFGTDEPRDLEYLRKAVNSAYAQEVQKLPELVCLWWDRRRRKLQRVRVDPAASRLTLLTGAQQPKVL